MPEYLAPGVYVEETSFRAKSIEGVSTTTTGFIGPARYGPIDIDPDIITSLGEFERICGDRQQLNFKSDKIHNYLWHAVRAFFEEGGKRLYIARVFNPLTGNYPPIKFGTIDTAPKVAENFADGHARAQLPKDGNNDNAFHIRARFPGAAGNLRLRFILRLGQNILGGEPGKPTLGALLNNDVVWINDITSPIASPPGGGSFYLAESFYDSTKKVQSWRFSNNKSAAEVLKLEDLTPNLDPALGDQIRVLTLTVIVEPSDETGFTLVWEGLALDPQHTKAGASDSISSRFAQSPGNQSQARTLPIVITLGDDLITGLDVLDAMLKANKDLSDALNNLKSSDAMRSIELILAGGNDGKRPVASDYEGKAEENKSTKTGLKAFEDIEDISIVAAPGATYGIENGYTADGMSIINLLISHASRMRYRIAVIDCGDNQTISQVRALRARIDSSYAALYYPWVRILDPVTRVEIHVPPSGFVAGIYTRNDVIRAVYKAPANEVVNLAIGFEQFINKSQQEVLNPEGINCFRFFEGRGYRLWGARTVSSDPEWKYVNLRRYFAYLERSIDKGTQWAVFEPNGPILWANVRRTIETFLLNEWQSGALLGEKPEKAFFVRCDRSTMTENDLDNGRLICLIGVAALRPAEFVIFRIGQWTADRKV